MKKLFSLALLLCLTAVAFARTDADSTKTRRTCYIDRIKFDGYNNYYLSTGAANLREGFSEHKLQNIGLGTDFDFGLRFYDYAFAGVSIGAKTTSALPMGTSLDALHLSVNIPIYFTARAYYPVNQNFYPLLEFSVGGSVYTFNTTLTLKDGAPTTGLEFEKQNKMNFRLGLGFDYKALSFSAGYLFDRCKVIENEETNYIKGEGQIYIRIGCRFNQHLSLSSLMD